MPRICCLQQLCGKREIIIISKYPESADVRVVGYSQKKVGQRDEKNCDCYG